MNDALYRAAKALMTQADGSLVGEGYQRGGGNVVMVLEVSVNHVCDLRDAIKAAETTSNVKHFNTNSVKS